MHEEEGRAGLDVTFKNILVALNHSLTLIRWVQ